MDRSWSLTFDPGSSPDHPLIIINDNAAHRWRTAVAVGSGCRCSSFDRRFPAQSTVAASYNLQSIFMIALCNRADHYIFALWFLSFFFFFFPRLTSAVGDWMSTILPHMVWP